MKRFFQVLAAFLVMSVLVIGWGSALKSQSGMLFVFFRLRQEHQPLALTPVKMPDSTKTQALQEWLRDERVTESQTLILVNLNNPLPDGYEADLE
jgi:hypothetical protein